MVNNIIGVTLGVIYYIIVFALILINFFAIPLIFFIPIVIIAMVKQNKRKFHKGIVVASVMWFSVILVKILFASDFFPPGGS